MPTWKPYVEPGSSGGAGSGSSGDTIIPLNASQVNTGGTAVVALLVGQRVKGGWITNPIDAPANLFINEINTATVVASGNTSEIVPGQTYTLHPSANAVSVNSTVSEHAFSGQGYN